MVAVVVVVVDDDDDDNPVINSVAVVIVDNVDVVDVDDRIIDVDDDDDPATHASLEPVVVPGGNDGSVLRRFIFDLRNIVACFFS